MPVYAYKGLNAGGRQVNGVVDAENPKAARSRLRVDGIFPTDLVEEKQKQGGVAAGLSMNVSQYFERITPQDLALLTRQLSTLVGAGLPLVDCISALIEQVEKSGIKRVLSQIREQVMEGVALADAMKAHPRMFSDLFTNMVRAGEASGALDVVLLRLADYTESSAALRDKVSSALTYPILMGTVGSAILLFLLAYVVPTITKIFSENNAQLPMMTTILLSISGFMQEYWWLVVGTILIIVISVRVSIRTPAGRLRFDRYILNIPYFGKVIKKVALARFSRTLATLLTSGIPLLTSLDIVKNVVSNLVLSQAIEDARASIREGQSIAPPLKKSGLFPAMLIHMIAVGEKSGELEQMLSRAADAYDREVDSSVSSLTSILEPVMIIFGGGVVLFIVMAILLPIFSMNELVK